MSGDRNVPGMQGSSPQYAVRVSGAGRVPGSQQSKGITETNVTKSEHLIVGLPPKKTEM